MIATTIKERLEKEPFEPFQVRSSSGMVYKVSQPHLVALMRSEVFIAEENSDRWVQLPYLHVAAIESSGRNGNGHSKHRRTPKDRK